MRRHSHGNAAQAPSSSQPGQGGWVKEDRDHRVQEGWMHEWERESVIRWDFAGLTSTFVNTFVNHISYITTSILFASYSEK